jgi:hypothetical protein
MTPAHLLFCATIAAGALAAVVFVATALAQQRLPLLPKPDAPPPVPQILENSKPVTAAGSNSRGWRLADLLPHL